MIRDRRETFLEQRDAFESRVKEYYRIQPAIAPLPLFNLGALARQQKVIRAAGIEPIYIIPPSIQDTPQVWELKKRGLIPLLMAYHQPRRYPEFFKAENRFDHKHLNHETAERFSRLFAADLAAYLSRGGNK